MRLFQVQRTERDVSSCFDSLKRSIADARAHLDEFAPNQVQHDAKVLRQETVVEELVAEYCLEAKLRKCIVADRYPDKGRINSAEGGIW